MRHFDTVSILTIVLTVVLFITALFIKGLTHDLLLEAGVFLVSVKLIHATYKNGVHTAKIEAMLDQILKKLKV